MVAHPGFSSARAPPGGLPGLLAEKVAPEERPDAALLAADDVAAAVEKPWKYTDEYDEAMAELGKDTP